MLPLLMSFTFTNDDPGFFADLASWLANVLMVFSALTGAGLGAAAVPRLASAQVVAGPSTAAGPQLQPARAARAVGIALALASLASMTISAGIWVGLHSAEPLSALGPTPIQQSDPVTPGASPSPTDSSQEETPEAPALVTVDLGLVSGAPATAYVGQQGALRQAMQDLGVTLAQTPGFVDAFPERCAEGVVVGPVEGVEGTVIAVGLGDGWNGLENEHTPEVSYDGGLLHQQFASPPKGLGVGERFHASAEVVVDGDRAFTAPFDLEVTARSGLSATWQVDDAGTVTCDVTT